MKDSECLWSRRGHKATYGVVKIPDNQAFYLHYQTTNEDVSLELQPRDRGNWRAEGIVTPKIVRFLGLTVLGPEHLNNNDIDLADIKFINDNYGSIHEVAEKLWFLNVTLREANTRQFLGIVWDLRAGGVSNACPYPIKFYSEDYYPYLCLPFRRPISNSHKQIWLEVVLDKEKLVCDQKGDVV